MIGKLSGIIDSFGNDHLILDVSGVGYKIYASTATLSRIGQKGDSASLLIITNVREDAITLYGFADVEEQEWFRLLTSVQGVGAKAGLSILASCAADKLAYIIASQDKAALTKADGVGPKLANRILTELKDKAGKIDLNISSGGGGGGGAAHSSSLAGASADVDRDAVSALVNLGYGGSDAMRAVAIVRGENAQEDDLGELLRLALKELGS